MQRTGLLLAALVFSVGVAGCGSSDDSADNLRQNLERVRSVVDAEGINLPAVPIPIDVGEDGRVARVAGFETEEIDDVVERLTGQPLFGRIVFLDKAQVAWMKRANIQHVTMAARPNEGLFFMVNGMPLPYLAWDDESLDALVDALGQLQDDGTDGAYLLEPRVYEALAVALPLLKSMGLRVDVRFPRDPDADMIPLPEDEDFALALTEEELDREPLQTVQLELEYKADRDGRWVPAVYGFTTLDLQKVGDPLDLNVPSLRLREDVRRRLQIEGIEALGVESRPDGLFVRFGDRLLPHLAWSEATLTNLTATLWDLYPEGVVLPDDARWVPLVRATAPMYNDFDMAVVLRFPVGDAR